MSEKQRDEIPTGGEQGGSSGREGEKDRQREPQRAAPRDPVFDEIESSGTDGKGTGGMGADLGGHGPVPGSEGSG